MSAPFSVSIQACKHILRRRQQLRWHHSNSSSAAGAVVYLQTSHEQVHSMKHIVGRRFTDEVVKHTISHQSWAFSVVQSPTGDCHIRGEHHVELQFCCCG